MSLVAFGDHKTAGILFVQQKFAACRIHILQVVGCLPSSVVRCDFQQVPGVDRRIQIYQGRDAFFAGLRPDPDGIRLPKLLKFHNRVGSFGVGSRGAQHEAYKGKVELHTASTTSADISRINIRLVRSFMAKTTGSSGIWPR